jgi:hypothetical protein
MELRMAEYLINVDLVREARDAGLIPGLADDGHGITVEQKNHMCNSEQYKGHFETLDLLRQELFVRQREVMLFLWGEWLDDADFNCDGQLDGLPANLVREIKALSYSLTGGGVIGVADVLSERDLERVKSVHAKYVEAKRT